MKVFWSPYHAAHTPELFIFRGNVKQHHERPERVETLLSAALDAGLNEVRVEPGAAAGEASPNLTATHDDDYVRFILDGHNKWSKLPGAGPEMVPGIRPLPETTARPSDIAGLAGRYMGDLASPIGAGTANASLSAVRVAEEAASSIVSKDNRFAYALCRPPGHHTTRSLAGGGCYFNNIAVAINVLQQQFPRIAVLDIDAHHGNGTQSHFYARSDVLTVSIHADPSQFYPFYWGYEDEKGIAAGEGFNHNLPVPVGTEDKDWTEAVDAGCRLIENFAPDCVVIALGQDPLANDPLGAMQISNEAFGRTGRRIASLNLPTLVVQEGGYLSQGLGPATKLFFDELQS